MKEYVFSVKRYLSVAGYKYLLFWTGGTLIDTYLLIGILDIISALAIAMTICSLFVLLFLWGRITSWKQRKVILHPSYLTYVGLMEKSVDYDGYGDRRRQITFHVFELDKLKLQRNALIATEGILCSDYKFSYNTPSRIEYPAKRLKIPSFFEGWEDLINQINTITGGRLK